MAKQTRGKKVTSKKGSRKTSRRASKKGSRKTKSRKVQRKIKPSTKYKTGDNEGYEGSCNTDKVAECVKLGKYCNVDTGNCIIPKAAKTKAKDPALAVVCLDVVAAGGGGE